MAIFTSKCPNCGTGFEAESEWVGQEAECPGCGMKIILSAPSSTPAENVKNGISFKVLLIASTVVLLLIIAGSTGVFLYQKMKSSKQARIATEEARKREEQVRVAEETRKQAEQARLAAEEARRREEQVRVAEETKKQAEQARLAAEEEKIHPKIKGAFGIALGDIVSFEKFSEEDIFSTKEDAIDKYQFTPRQMFLNFKYCCAKVSPQSKVIYEIKGERSMGENIDNLTPEIEKVLAIFQEKYGEKFVIGQPREEECIGQGTQLKIKQQIVPFVLTREGRSIEVYSRIVLNQIKNAGTMRICYIGIRYIDSSLSQKAVQEHMEMKRKSAINAVGRIDPNSF